jgi:hypothetical protein
MIELIIAACMTVSAECREFRMQYDAREVSLMTCMIAGQPQVARWQQANPKWRVTRWHCDLHDPRSSRL